MIPPIRDVKHRFPPGECDHTREIRGLSPHPASFYASRGSAQVQSQAAISEQDILTLLRFFNSMAEANVAFEVSGEIGACADRVLQNLFLGNHRENYLKEQESTKRAIRFCLIVALASQPVNQSISIAGIRNSLGEILCDPTRASLTRAMQAAMHNYSITQGYFYVERAIATVLDTNSDRDWRLCVKDWLAGLVEQLLPCGYGKHKPFENDTITMAWIVGNYGRDPRLPIGLSTERYFDVISKYPPIPEDLIDLK